MILRAVLTVVLPFAAGYFLSYLYRSVNAVIAGRLTADLGLGSGELGLMTAAFFLSFALFQVPLGVLLDRYGPRRVQAGLLLLAAAGAVVFSLGTDEAALIAGRALIGLGVSGGLMAGLKAITLWFPRQRWPLVNGCFLAMGGLGAMAATTPVEWALGFTDWRGLFVILAGMTLVVSLAILLVVPERGDAPAATTLREALSGIRRVFSDGLFWSVAPMTITVTGTAIALQSLWMGPWLSDVAGLDESQVAIRLFVMAAALAAGFVLGGLAADLAERAGIPLTRLVGGGAALFIVLQVCVVLQVAPLAYWPWVWFGLTSNIGTLIYPILSRHFPLAYAGRANSAHNMLLFGAAFGLQAAIGWALDLWPATAAGRPPSEAYDAVFGVLVAVQALSLLWFWIAPARRRAERQDEAAPC